MSSSRRNSPSDAPTKCPTCGKRAVVAVREDIVLAVRGRSRRFEQVEHERCTACGEQIFSLETSKRFDMAVLGSRKRHAA